MKRTFIFGVVYILDNPEMEDGIETQTLDIELTLDTKKISNEDYLQDKIGQAGEKGKKYLTEEAINRILDVDNNYIVDKETNNDIEDFFEN